MRETWSGRAGFILAAIGSAVGLGSIWRFPYEVGANGGAAFVPLMIALAAYSIAYGDVGATVRFLFARMRLGSAAAAAFFVLLFVAAACFGGGLATVFSFNVWSHWNPTVFDALDHLTSNVMLPLGGLALAVFAGWALPQAVLAEELGLTPRGAGLLRWATPALIAATALAPLLI